MGCALTMRPLPCFEDGPVRPPETETHEVTASFGDLLARRAKRLYMSPLLQRRPSSSGLGRGPFTAETRVRFP
jgi:hypothetical protein